MTSVLLVLCLVVSRLNALPGLFTFSTSSVIPIHRVQSNTIQSPYVDVNVTVSGVVTAIRQKAGYYLQASRSEWDLDIHTSEAIYVYDGNVTRRPNIGDKIIITGTVKEYTSSFPHGGLSITQITSVSNFKILKSAADICSMSNCIPRAHLDKLLDASDRRTANPSPASGISAADLAIFYQTIGVPPVIINECLSREEFCYKQPTQHVFSKNPFIYPADHKPLANDTQITLNNGIGFWKALEHMIVYVRSPRVIDGPDRYGNIFVVSHNGSKATGLSTSGHLVTTYARDIDEVDTNPERIMISKPTNSSVVPCKAGDILDDIIGVVDYSFGMPKIIPFNRPNVALSMPTKPVLTRSPMKVTSSFDCPASVATYNVQNLGYQPKRIISLANQIIHNLGLPDILAIQEIMDNVGPKNSSELDADRILDLLVKHVNADVGNEGQFSYKWTQISPNAANADGGKPGNNIRQVFLYNSARVTLALSVEGRAGSPTDRIKYDAVSGAPSVNPGRLAPTHPSFMRSRKPLAAVFDVVCRRGGEKRVWVINIHGSSKMGSTPLYGVIQEPLNSGLEKRIQQMQVVADFVQELQRADENVLVLGDMNDFDYVPSLQRLEAVGLKELTKDVLPDTERWSYVHEGQAQMLDHIYGWENMLIDIEILHINTIRGPTGFSDHDPIIATVNLASTRSSAKDSKRIKSTSKFGGIAGFIKSKLQSLAIFVRGRLFGFRDAVQMDQNDFMDIDTDSVDTTVTLGDLKSQTMGRKRPFEDEAIALVFDEGSQHDPANRRKVVVRKNSNGPRRVMEA